MPMRHMYTVEDILAETNGTRVKVIAEYGIDNDRIVVTGELYYERQDNDGCFLGMNPTNVAWFMTVFSRHSHDFARLSISTCLTQEQVHP